MSKMALRSRCRAIASWLDSVQFNFAPAASKLREAGLVVAALSMTVPGYYASTSHGGWGNAGDPAVSIAASAVAFRGGDMMNSPVMIPNVRTCATDDAVWFIDHVRALLKESDSFIPLRFDEFNVTADQQAALYSGAADRGDLFLVAEVSGQRVGELNLRRGTRAAFKHSVLLGISVAREWRNRRVGSALMQHAIEWSRADPTIRRIELHVLSTNGPGIRLYERFGFVVEGRRRGAVRVDDRFVDDLLMACYVC